MSRASFGYYSPEASVRFGKNRINITPSLGRPDPDNEFKEFRGIGWNPKHLPPDRVVWAEGIRESIVPLWLRHPRSLKRQELLQSSFPPQWKELCGVVFAWYSAEGQSAIVWNRAHRLVKQVTPGAWKWCEEAFEKTMDPVPFRHELLSDRAKASCWMLQCISKDSRKLWGGLPERDPSFLPGLTELLFPQKKPNRDSRLMLWVEDTASSSYLRVIEQAQWGVAKRKELAERFLPIPPDNWRISVAYR